MRRSLVHKATACAGVLVLLTAATAVAGTGVGERFDLGEVNRVNQTSVLAGADAGPMLTVRNTSNDAGATALNLTVEDGKPPLKTNSSTRVTNLNADAVDGYDANDMARVARGETENYFSIVTFADQATITIEVPKPGFVLLNGQMTASTASAACNPCYAHMRLHDQTAADDSPAIVGSVGNGTTSTSNEALATTYVFPATAGTRTYTLTAGKFPGGATVNFYNPVLTGLYIPFGPTGSKALAPEAP